MYRRITCNDCNYTLQECWDSFIKMKKAQGLAVGSLGNYQLVYDKFLYHNDLSGNEYVSIIDSDFINDWAVRLIDKMKPESVNSYVRIFRIFCYWLMEKDYIPIFKIKLMKHQEAEVEIYTDDELKRLTRRPKCDDFAEHRTYTIICFILSTGARAGTICNLRKEDIDFYKDEIHYTHLKNKKVATIPLSSSLKEELLRFTKKWKVDSEYLFPNVMGEQLTVSGLRQAHNKYCKRLGVRPLGVHAMRHNFARAWIKNNGNALKLQKVLTHSTLAMTKHYVRLYSDDLKEGYENYSLLDTMR